MTTNKLLLLGIISGKIPSYHRLMTKIYWTNFSTFYVEFVDVLNVETYLYFTVWEEFDSFYHLYAFQW